MKSKILSTCVGWMILAVVATPVALRAQLTFTTNNGAITITGYTGSWGAVVIPDTTNGYPVTSIGDDAFNASVNANCYNLTSVTIPDSVTNIGRYAFFSATSLGNVTFGTNVTSIGVDAFAFCIDLSSVTIPSSVTSIGAAAFNDCYRLTSVTIPSKVTSLGDDAFAYCSGLAAVYFQGNAPSGDASVFSNDNNPIVYYLAGTTGWSQFLSEVSLTGMLWNPQIQTSDGSFGVQANQFGFNITGPTDILIVVEACTNLGSPVWCPLQTNTLVGGSLYFSDPAWTNCLSRFYRIRSP
jgi:hypothetical protein